MRGIRSTELIRLSVPVAPHVPRPLPSFTDVRGECEENNDSEQPPTRFRTKRDPLRGRPRRRPCINRCCSPSGAARGRGARTRRLPPRPSCGHQKSCSSTDIDIDVSLFSLGEMHGRSGEEGRALVTLKRTVTPPSPSLPPSSPRPRSGEECTLPFRDEVRHTRDHQVTRAFVT